jgi:hypothetical protein
MATEPDNIVPAPLRKADRRTERMAEDIQNCQTQRIEIA